MNTLAEERGTTLLAVARDAIAERLGEAGIGQGTHASWLQEPGASFVTLTQQGALRGCIGSLQAHRPLGLDVAANAENAAFRDPRFAPLTLQEWPQVAAEVSLLTAPEKAEFGDEIDLLGRLRPGVAGWQRAPRKFLDDDAHLPLIDDHQPQHGARRDQQHQQQHDKPNSYDEQKRTVLRHGPPPLSWPDLNEYLNRTPGGVPIPDL